MLLIPFNTWTMAALTRGGYLSREEVLNVVALGFIVLR